MDILINTIFTLSGFLLGTIYSWWSNCKAEKKHKRNVILHLSTQFEKSELILNSIQSEFYFWVEILKNGGLSKGVKSLGLQGIDNITVFNNDFIKSERLFNSEEKRIISDYISMNNVLAHHYLRLNEYIHDGNFVKVIYQLQVLLVQWFGYIETMHVIIRNISAETKDYNFKPAGEGNKYYAELYDIKYKEINDIVNDIYNGKLPQH
ncbi:hypothetical protein [Citrobacter braakii]|uniref:hypothetical protein n=1 Tax=Citrobacter braakii TaxID=57706 RepID=UPI0018EDF6CB|nr:hypothetical protein [Citrobacter braakii]MBJ9239792.1 hypothetical protein [Citrobacter braakii]